MKPSILLVPLVALLGSTALAADSDTPPPKPAAPAAPAAPASPAPNSPVSVTGKATITIDVNGQKVTREIDLGKVAPLNFGNLVGDGAQVTLGVSGVKVESVKSKKPAETRTWLGVASDELSDEVREQLPVTNGTGLVIREVFPESAAAKAGLEKNDVLVRLDDQILTNPEQLRALVGSKKEGNTVRLTYLRKGKEASVEVKLGTHVEESTRGRIDEIVRKALDTADVSLGKDARLIGSISVATSATPAAGKEGDAANSSGKAEKSKTPAEMRPWLGVATDGLSDDVRAQLPVLDGTGLIVHSVIEDSPAAKAGLKKDDVLNLLDNQILTNSDQLRKLVYARKDGDLVHLTYFRKGQSATVEVKLGSHAEEPVITRLQTHLELLNGAVKSLEKSAGAEVKSVIEPLIIQRNAAFDKGGNLFFTIQSQADAGGNPSTQAEHWSLTTKNGETDVTEAIKRLEKTLRDAGVSEQVIAQTRQAVAEAVARIQKAVGDGSAPRDEVQRNAQKAVEEVLRSLEHAWRPEEGEASKIPPAVSR